MKKKDILIGEIKKIFLFLSLFFILICCQYRYISRKNVIKLNELFDNIFNKYYKDVFRLTYSYTLNKSDSEDITQKAFTKLYENINKFKSDDDNVKKWLFKIASNECKNFRKSYWIKNIIKNDELLNVNCFSMDNDLLNCLMGISFKYRIPLYLYYYEGYSIKEISLILNKTENCIKQRLKRGKEVLRKEIGDE